IVVDVVGNHLVPMRSQQGRLSGDALVLAARLFVIVVHHENFHGRGLPYSPSEAVPVWATESFGCVDGHGDDRNVQSCPLLSAGAGPVNWPRKRSTSSSCRHWPVCSTSHEWPHRWKTPLRWSACTNRRRTTWANRCVGRDTRT